MMIVLSLLLAIFPLLGVGWIVTSNGLTTVDGLFMTLILLTLAGILFLNIVLDIRKRMRPKKEDAAQIEKTA